MQVKAILTDRANQYQKKPAIIFKDSTISFQQMDEQVCKVANGLRSQGVKKADKVAVYLPNIPPYIISYLSLYSLGAVVVPLDFMLTNQDVINFINHSESTALITMEKKGCDLNKIKTACPQLIAIISCGSKTEAVSATWESLMQESGDFQAEEVTEDDDASIFYTSGSTGKPKGVLLTYAHLDNPVETISQYLEVTDQDSYLCAGVPFSHIGGLDYMLFMLFFGSTLYLMDRFHPFETIKNIQAHKPTILCIVPAMFYAILSIKNCEEFDLSSLRYAAVFGAPSAPPLLKRFSMLCPNASLVNGWGMTETSAPNTFSPKNIDKINSIGHFGVNLDARIVDQNGDNVQLNGKGELIVKGKALMKEYFKEKELTRQSLTDDGWFKTGDIATKDQDGLFYIVGRIKEMIKVGGEIVMAPEVEAILQHHPAISEVAVIGIPDKLRGEVVKAFVVLKEGQATDEAQLKYFSREKMAHFKVPHQFEIRSQLPKNRTGKIDKENLKKEMMQVS